jgi:GTPase
MAPFKSGFISIVGRPNVGKSTLFNRLLGDKIAIVAEKPQTTRNRILGIKNVEGGQLIFLDTPGIHQGRSELNQRMVEQPLLQVEMQISFSFSSRQPPHSWKKTSR